MPKTKKRAGSCCGRRRTRSPQRKRRTVKDQEVKGLVDDDQNEKDSFLSGIMSGQIHPSTQEEEICCGARRKISINPPCKSLILAYSVS